MPEPKSGVLPLHHEGSVGCAVSDVRPSEVGDRGSKTAFPTEVTLTNPLGDCGNVDQKVSNRWYKQISWLVMTVKPRRRMSAPERRRQLIDVGRATFAELGLDGTSMEELAARAGVSKPVVYEHFGSKDGLYDVVVMEEMGRLEHVIEESIQQGRARARIENTVLALLTYVEEHTDGYTILARDLGSTGGFATLLGNATSHVSPILVAAFERANLDGSMAPLYSQALVGMVSQTAQWWLDEHQADSYPDKETVAAHIVNLCWNGLAGMESNPTLSPKALRGRSSEGVRLGAGEDADPHRR